MILFDKHFSRISRMANCAVNGGCSSDYIAVSISILSFLLLLAKWTLPYVIHKIPRPKGSSFWIVAIQVIASFNLLLSLVMALNFLKVKNRWWWISCYLWAVWVEGPLGFGLLLSCRIAQAYKLYYIFLKRRLPPVRMYNFLPLILLPWIAAAAFIHIIKPLNQRCHMGTEWMIPVICLHGLYVVALICITGAVRHVEFRFDELKELWRGILVSAFSIGVWVISYVLNEIHDDIAWLQVISRFLLLLMSSILVLAFFSFSISHPLVSLLSLRRMDQAVYGTMGRALGIPDSGLIIPSESSQVIDPDVPLEKLLLNRKFRQSFMAFADSCLAGESVHFYDEVQQLERIPLADHTRRIYMARHIVEEYIVAGATFEVNISHKTRQDILTTTDLSQPELFKNALNELIHLMKMNLARDYWSSTLSMKLKENNNRAAGQELEQVTSYNFSPRLSSVHCSDDPFHQENINMERNSSHDTGWR